MGPDELHGQLHQGSHTNSRFHIVAEYEERAACGNHASMQSHAIDDCGHGQLGHAGMEEGTLEVMTCERPGDLEERVGLVRICQVGTGDNHVAHLLCQCLEHIGTGCPRGNAGLMLNCGIVDMWHHAIDVTVQQLGLVGVGLHPCQLCGFALGDNVAQLSVAVGIELLHSGEDCPWVLDIATEVGYRLGIVSTTLADGLPMSAALPLEVLAVGCDTSASHDGSPDDDGGSFLLGQCSL